MQFEPSLKPATLIKRYKRFLADIALPDGSVTTIHCANTGAMTGCATPGCTIWYSESNNPKRKYPLSWELTETAQGHKICINTLRANPLVVEAIHKGTISELQGYDSLTTEVKYGEENSRIDILLNANSTPPCFVEVKSVTLLADTERKEANIKKESKLSGQGYFPDTVTSRGQKHLRELTKEVKNGNRAVLLFAVLHSGIEKVSPALHIDATYSLLIEEAQKEGVEILCYRAEINQHGMELVSAVEWDVK